MTKIFRFSILVVALLLAGNTAAGLPVVRAVLFYSPSCGHCHYVINEVLPPLFDQHGDQLQIVGVNTANADGQALYQAAIQRFNIPDTRRGVPTLIVGDVVLVGSGEIPSQLPLLIDQHLAADGIDWPDVPGLAAAVQTSEPAAPADDAAIETGRDDILSKIQRDPVGNSLAIGLLAGMIGIVGYVGNQAGWRLERLTGRAAIAKRGWRFWAVGALCLIGLGVSLYMAYVETTNTTAVCGPVGDCNTVQQSPYATLFGMVPVGVVGVLGYTLMLALWAGSQWVDQFKALSSSVLLALALVGTLFSIYLTFLEPFVIGATCAWCLTSALCMALILLFVAGSISPQSKARSR